MASCGVSTSRLGTQPSLPTLRTRTRPASSRMAGNSLPTSGTGGSPASSGVAGASDLSNSTVCPTAAGQTVLLLRSDAPATPLDAGDPPVPLVGNELPAIREEAGRVLVRSVGKDGWVPRRDVLTPKEAIAYYTDQITSNPQNTTLYTRRAKAYEL